jgi:hypothetical protein
MDKKVKKIMIISAIAILILFLVFLGTRDFCPPWKKYVNYNMPDIPPKCYTPAPDAGKVCYQYSDCTSWFCKGDENNPIIKECELKTNQQNYCPGVSGYCTDGGDVGGIRIDKKDYVSIELLA